MAGVMKLACLLLACMVVAAPMAAEAAITCGAVASAVAPCLGYVRSGGAVPRACCSGIRSLNSAARTTPDRQQTCRCLKSAAGSLGGYYNSGRVAGLPRACGVNIPYSISPSTNCNNVK